MKISRKLNIVNKIIKTELLLTIMVAISIGCSDKNKPERSDDLNNYIKVSDITKPPKITAPNGIEFDTNIIEIPVGLYFYDNRNNSYARGNVTGVIGKNITTIGNGAFIYNQLIKLDLPNAISIGEGAFAYNKLDTLYLPEARTIEQAAFAINQLTVLDLPKADSIGEWAFSTNKLTKIILPNATKICWGAFSGNQITELDLPKADSIGEWAFQINKLTKIILPNVTIIKYWAFAGNPDLTEVHIYTAPALLKIGADIFGQNEVNKKQVEKPTEFFDYTVNKNTVTIFIKKAKWKSAMEEKFKDYNVVVKVLE